MNKKKIDSQPHFVKIIDYNEEPWITDLVFGQKGSGSHGHLSASGAAIWYLRDEQGREIIKNGKVVKEGDELEAEAKKGEIRLKKR